MPRIHNEEDPLYENPDTFTGRYGQRRLPADHKFYWDRHGIHAAYGFIVALLLLLHWSIPIVVAYLFVQYERSENVSINDFAYVDLAGFKYGFLAGVAVLALAVWLTPLTIDMLR